MLKNIRKVVAVPMLLLFVALFSDFREFFSTEFTQTLTFTQFIPSILKSIEVIGWLTLGFLFIALLTILFGRVYCSFLCPLGLLQDLFARLKRKRKYRFLTAQNKLRWVLLAASIITFLSGTILIINVLDPYSNFGRIITYLFKPLVVWVNNGFADVLQNQQIFWLYPDKVIFIGIAKAAFPIGLTLLLLFFSVRYGRLFCNTICPVGTLLGEISRFSVYKIRLDKNNCVACGKCVSVCKSSCINVKDKTVDMSRCVACYNCLDTCKFDALEYAYGVKKKSVDIVDTPPVKESVLKPMNKRAFIGSVIGLYAGTTVLGQEQKRKQQRRKCDDDCRNCVTGCSSSAKVENPPLVVSTPPGSLSLDRFKDKCTACSLCVAACPTNVLQPSITAYGWDGLLQPYMDFKTSYCNFDCNKCGEVCPTGAILPLTIEEKHTTQIGIAHFETTNCVVYKRGKACGACNEHCPTKAVKMVDYKNGLLIPEVEADLCVGCGACEHACPEDYPFKAIYVEGSKIHKDAKKPETKKLEAPDMEEDFPF